MKNTIHYLICALGIICTTILIACSIEENRAESTSGVQKATAVVRAQSNGLTVEQENIKRRIELENDPGSIKHLYMISAATGDVLLYSTVKGKVTSSGKRLTPYSVAIRTGEYGNGGEGFRVDFNGHSMVTSEVLQDDGTYGSSVEYIYWFDAQGRYMSVIPSAGIQIIFSNQPIVTKKVILNLSTVKE